MESALDQPISSSYLYANAQPSVKMDPEGTTPYGPGQGDDARWGYCHQSGEVAMRCYSYTGRPPSTFSLVIGGLKDTVVGAKNHPVAMGVNIVMSTAGVAVTYGARYVYVACKASKAIGGLNSIVHQVDCVSRALKAVGLGVTMVAAGNAAFRKACNEDKKDRRPH